MKKTKIICSIGPSSVNPDTMEQMVLSGMNVARINFSHATLEEKQMVVASVKEVRKRTGVPVAILYDTKGPEFRNGVVKEGGIDLVAGNTIRIVKEDVIGDENRFSVNHPNAIDSLKVGNYVLLENGLMKIEVISVEEDGVTCKVINGGNLGDRKSLSVPGVKLNVPFVGDVDREDIIYACRHEGDFLALSFVSTVEEVLEVKKILEEENRTDLKIIAKIESTLGVANLNSILEEVDGIMVARGDLGVEAPMAELPVIQKAIAKRCREQGKICIVATEMLESMKKNARPTRAEVSDVANAVLDGTDAVMLSGESTVGKYPIETVRFMANICETTEAHLNYHDHVDYKKRIGLTQTIASCVIESADLLNSKLIVTPTMSGFTARKISNLRPKCLVLATCPDEKVMRGLALNFGVYTRQLPILTTTDEIINASLKEAKNFTSLNKGDTVIVTGGFPTSNAKTTNLMKIEEI